MLDVFDYVPLLSEAYDERYVRETLEESVSVGGVVYRNENAVDGRLRSEFHVQFPNSNGKGFADLEAFAEEKGLSTVFAFPALLPERRQVRDEALGTTTGSAGQTFPLSHRYVAAATLKVYVDDVEQVLDTDYTFTGNEVAPLLTTLASIDAGALTVDYDFRHPCRIDEFEPVSLVGLQRMGTVASPGIRRARLVVSETKPGGRFA